MFYFISLTIQPYQHAELLKLYYMDIWFVKLNKHSMFLLYTFECSNEHYYLTLQIILIIFSLFSVN